MKNRLKTSKMDFCKLRKSSKSYLSRTSLSILFVLKIEQVFVLLKISIKAKERKNHSKSVSPQTIAFMGFRCFYHQSSRLKVPEADSV